MADRAMVRALRDARPAGGTGCVRAVGECRHRVVRHDWLRLVRSEARHGHDVQTRRTDGALAGMLALRPQLRRTVRTAHAILLGIELLAVLPGFEDIDRYEYLASTIGASLLALT